MSEELDAKTGELTEPIPSLGTQVMVFGTTDLNGIVDRATQISNRLKDIVEKAQLYSMIKDKKYVKAEGWTAMCAMLGVFPSAEYCRKVEREDEICYEARIVLRHISGNEVGAGEALCSSKERNWTARDEFAIKSMAQTRATGKACRLSFSWIMALAGYQVTPSEEMIHEDLGPKIVMPRSRPAPESVPETKPVPTDFNQADSGSPKPKREIIAEPRTLTVEEERALKVPSSKFFARLHKVAREKNVSPEAMKTAMMNLFKKDSSRDLLDGECALLIRAIESGSVR